MRREAVQVDVGGHLVRITTPERVLYPRTGFTKAAMLEYDAAVAPAMLPHVVERPISLRRFPEGVEGNTWYQTRCGSSHPDYVTTQVLTVAGGRPQDYCGGEPFHDRVPPVAHAPRRSRHADDGRVRPRPR